MLKFEKVSFEQFYKSCRDLNMEFEDDVIKYIWDSIKLPKRSTSGSAGYDFYMPFSTIAYKEDVYYSEDDNSGEIVRNYITIPTGIRWICDEDYVLLCAPRSGLGFKNGFKLSNTIGVIDKDYWKSDNEGHILAKFCVESTVKLDAGKAFMQGIITPFVTVDDDCEDGVRNGGFGSTDNN